MCRHRRGYRSDGLRPACFDRCGIVGRQRFSCAGTTLTVTAVGNATNGTAILNAGAVTFTPSPGFVGTTYFNYTVTGGGQPATGQVRVIVGANSAPVFTGREFATGRKTHPWCFRKRHCPRRSGIRKARRSVSCRLGLRLAGLYPSILLPVRWSSRPPSISTAAPASG